MRKTFNKDQIGDILTFINQNIKKAKLKKNEEYRASLMAEETLTLLKEHVIGDEIMVSVSDFFGALTIRMVAKGKAFDLFEVSASDEMQAALMQSFAEDIKYKNHKDTNIITINAYKSRYMMIYAMIGAAVCSLLISFLLKKILPADVCNAIAMNVMSPGKDMFMNCLNMLIPLLVFFSIASAIAGFGNTSQLGKISGKIIGIYSMTTVVATCLGFLLVEIIKPYRFASADLFLNAGDINMDLSFKDTIVNIIPDNFVGAFRNADTIQIIFLAVFIGLAITAVGEKAKPIQDFINAGNEIFLKMTNMLIKFMPVMIFCMLGEMMLASSSKTSGMGMPIFMGIVVYLLSIVVLITFYHVLLRVLGRVNPLVFTRKYLPHLLEIMGMGSSSAAIPLNMQICENLGVDKKVYSLSIPLGATINMDGTTIYMAVFGLLLARLYGVQINFTFYLMMVFAIFMLSAGAPPVMGSSIICLSALLRTMGIPVGEAIGMVLGVEAIAGLVRTVNNAICDMAGTLIVANQENLLDKEKYYS